MAIKDLNLDINTLKFAINTAWQFEFLCKKTKEGRIKAKAFSLMQETLQHYLRETEDIASMPQDEIMSDFEIRQEERIRFLKELTFSIGDDFEREKKEIVENLKRAGILNENGELSDNYK